MTLSARLKDRARWKSSLFDVAIWLLFGLAITEGLSRYAPGHPIVVGTPSIPTGIYWLDTDRVLPAREGYVTFDYNPSQAWLQHRYGEHRVHTKQVLGVAGDRVEALPGRRLQVCPPPLPYTGDVPPCLPAGHVEAVDSNGLPMYGWLPEGSTYVLRSGEIWVYGEHQKSLDSRYHGPVAVQALRGVARPVYLFAMS